MKWVLAFLFVTVGVSFVFGTYIDALRPVTAVTLALKAGAVFTGLTSAVGLWACLTFPFQKTMEGGCSDCKAKDVKIAELEDLVCK